MQTNELAVDLLFEIRALIEESRKHVAVAVNVALSLLHWKIGKKINDAIGDKNHSELYGQKIVVSLVRQLSWTHILAVIPIEDELKRNFYMDKSNIRVAEYLTVLPDKKLLEEKLRRSIERAKTRLLQRDL